MLTATVIFVLTYAVVALGRLPGLRLDRTGAAVVGAAFRCLGRGFPNRSAILISPKGNPMALINDEVAQQLKEEFANLDHPVRLAVFSQTIADPGSEQVKRLVEELAALDERLTAESYNYVTDTEKVEALGIQRTPAIAVLGKEDYGVRLYGMPSGYEFGSLLDAILMVSRAESGLSEETRMALAAIEKPVHVQVFSTPT